MRILSEIIIDSVCGAGCAALDLPAAYALNRLCFRGKDATKMLFLSPVRIPVIVSGFILLPIVQLCG